MEKIRRMWEVWADAEVKAKNLQVLVMFLAVLLGVETLSLVVYLSKPKPIYYINGTQGLALPLESNTEMVKAFAAGFIANLANYTFSTIDKCYEQVSNLCSPEYLSRMKVSLLKEKDTIKNNSIASLFAIESVEVKQDGEDWKVRIKGQHSLYMAGQELKKDQYQYILKIVKSVPTAGNPFGLMVDDVQGGNTEGNI